MGSFKTWLEFGGGGGAATTAMHGGLSAFDRGNVNMNIRSKTQTQDGRVGHADDEGPKTPPEVTFGLRTPSERKRSKERGSRSIHKRRGGVTRDTRPDIVY